MLSGDMGWPTRHDKIGLTDDRTSSSGCRPGHPLIFARALFPLLEALRGDKAAWKIVDAHPDWVRPVPIDRPAPSDVNTWEAYQALRAR